MEDSTFRSDVETGEFSDDATEVPQPQAAPPPNSEAENCGRIFFIIATIITVIVVIAVVVVKAVQRNDDEYSRFRRSIPDPVYHGRVLSPNIPVTTCGRTRSEALARDCTFDILVGAWMPPLCYDAELARMSHSENTTLTFLGGSEPFPWWEDNDHTTPIPQDKLWSLDSMVGHTWEAFNVAHCLYKWQSLLKATERLKNGEKNVWVYDQVMKTGHSRVCHELISQKGGGFNAKAEVRFAFGRCIRLDITDD